MEWKRKEVRVLLNKITSKIAAHKTQNSLIYGIETWNRPSWIKLMWYCPFSSTWVCQTLNLNFSTHNLRSFLHSMKIFPCVLSYQYWFYMVGLMMKIKHKRYEKKHPQQQLLSSSDHTIPFFLLRILIFFQR